MVLLLTACNHAQPPSPPDAGLVKTCAKPPAPLRRLTGAEYDATVRDLLGDTTRPSQAFPRDEESQGFDNYAQTQSVAPLLAEQYLSAAETLAANADPARLSGCDPASATEATCLQQLLTKFGRRAFRRPLSADEVSRLSAVFTAVRAQDDFPAAMRAVVSVLLESPQFLYRFESDPLTSFELASRLSYFLWGAGPDDALLDAAQSGTLDLEAQARRLLADPRSHEVVRRFHLQWLGVAHLADRSKDPQRYGDFPGLATQLQEETARFTEWSVFDGAGDARRLFTGHTTFVNSRLADLYGMIGIDGPDFVQVDTGLTARIGLLTQGSVLAQWSKADQTSPVLRGKFVRERLMCKPPPPPPGNVVAMLSTPDAGTTRERFAAHLSDPSCSGCHQLLDPIGFGFEKYDAIGAYRSTENGVAIDASGEVIAGGDLDGTFDGALQLSTKLAASSDVRHCLTLQWYRFAFGRSETDDDACSLAQAHAAFEQSGWNTRELLIALTQTDAFVGSAR